MADVAVAAAVNGDLEMETTTEEEEEEEEEMAAAALAAGDDRRGGDVGGGGGEEGGVGAMRKSMIMTLSSEDNETNATEASSSSDGSGGVDSRTKDQQGQQRRGESGEEEEEQQQQQEQGQKEEQKEEQRQEEEEEGIEATIDEGHNDCNDGDDGEGEDDDDENDDCQLSVGEQPIVGGPSTPEVQTRRSRSPISQFFLCCVNEDEVSSTKYSYGSGGSAAGAPSSSSSSSVAPAVVPPPFPAACRACVALWTEKTRERFERNIESLLSSVDGGRQDGGGGGGVGGGMDGAVAAGRTWSRNFESRYRKLIAGGLAALREVEEAERDAAAASVSDEEKDGEDDDLLPPQPRHRRSLLGFPRNRETRLKWMRRKITMSSPRTHHHGVSVRPVGGSPCKSSSCGGSVSGGDPRLQRQSTAAMVRRAQSFDDHVLRSQRLVRGAALRHPQRTAPPSAASSSVVGCQALALSDADCAGRTGGSGSGGGSGKGGGGQGDGGGSGGGDSRGRSSGGQMFTALPRTLNTLVCECGASDKTLADDPGETHFGDRSLLESDDEDGGYDSDPEFVQTHRYSADIIKSSYIEEEDDEDGESDVGCGIGPSEGGSGAYAEADNKENEGGVMDFNDAERMSQLIGEVMHGSMTLIWHPSESSDGTSGPESPPANRVQPPTCVMAWIELGCRVKGQIIQPKLVWRNAYHHDAQGAAAAGAGPTDARQRGMAAVVPSDSLRSVDILDIARILTYREIDRERYPLAKTSKSFTIVTTEGKVHLFEVSDASERDRLVSGLKLLVARLASLIIVGDKRLFDDFFYPTTSSDFQRKFCGEGSAVSYVDS